MEDQRIKKSVGWAMLGKFRARQGLIQENSMLGPKPTGAVPHPVERALKGITQNYLAVRWQRDKRA